MEKQEDKETAQSLGHNNHKIAKIQSETLATQVQIKQEVAKMAEIKAEKETFLRYPRRKSSPERIDSCGEAGNIGKTSIKLLQINKQSQRDYIQQ